MPRKRVKARAEAPSPSGWHPIRPVLRTLRTTVLVALMLYGAGLAVGRTEGFRSLVAQRLEKTLGVPVKLDDASLSAGYALSLRGLVTEGARGGNSPGLSARRVKLAWRWSDVFRRGRPGLARVEIEKPTLVFFRGEAGGWEPASLAPLADFLARHAQLGALNEQADPPASAGDNPQAGASLTGRKPSAPFTEDLARSETAIVMDHGRISWWTNDLLPAASVEEVYFRATPIRVPERRMTHYRLKVERVSSARGMALRDLEIELIDTGDQQLILRFQGDHLAAVPNS